MVIGDTPVVRRRATRVSTSAASVVFSGRKVLTPEDKYDKMIREEVDEVWLALNHTYMVLKAESHQAKLDPTICRFCHLMMIVEKGMAAYRKRPPFVPDHLK
jgi:hypothetical protein